MWVIDLKFAPGLPPGWVSSKIKSFLSCASLHKRNIVIIVIPPIRDAAPPWHESGKLERDNTPLPAGWCHQEVWIS